MTTLKAHFDGKVLVPVEPVDLPTGRLLEIEVRDAAEPPPGSPAAILKAMQALPHVPSEDVDELERAIEEGKLPIRYEGVFDDEEE